jgi:hypothetical protein
MEGFSEGFFGDDFFHFQISFFDIGDSFTGVDFFEGVSERDIIRILLYEEIEMMCF